LTLFSTILVEKVEKSSFISLQSDKQKPKFFPQKLPIYPVTPSQSPTNKPYLFPKMLNLQGKLGHATVFRGTRFFYYDFSPPLQFIFRGKNPFLYFLFSSY